MPLDHALSALPARSAVAPDWSLALFSSRETLPTLARSVCAAVAAAAGRSAVIDIVVNGNASLSTQTAAWLSQGIERPETTQVRLWSVAMGDKAHAWNSYVHDIWDGCSRLAFFVDGYARVQPDALARIDAGMHARGPQTLAGSGLPSMGPSARRLRKELLRDGGAHGNLYCLRASVLAELRRRGFRLPLGIYRTDPLLMAVIAFNLDPAQNEWEPLRRIYADPVATWAYDPPRWWSPADIKTAVKRRMRQAQGQLETWAIRQHLALDRRGFEELPRTTAELVGQWLARSPSQYRPNDRWSPLLGKAVRDLARPRDWSASDRPPQLVAALGTPLAAQ